MKISDFGFKLTDLLNSPKTSGRVLSGVSESSKTEYDDIRMRVVKYSAG